MPKASKFSPDEGITIYDLKDNEAVHYGEQSKGYVGKNKIKPLPNENTDTKGVTFTLNSDGSITANGKATGGEAIYAFTFDLPSGSYIMSGVTGGSGSTFFIDTYNTKWTDRVYSLDGDVNVNYGGNVGHVFRIVIVSGYTANNLTFYPMIRLASIPDNTYEPYIHPNTEIPDKMSYADNAILGAKNFLQNKVTARSQHGVTLTKDSDGVITLNGTVDTNDFFNFMVQGAALGWDYNLVGKTYIASYGDTTNNSHVLMQMYKLDGTSNVNVSGNNDSQPITVTNEGLATANASINIQIKANSKDVVFDNLKLYPMFRLSTDTDKTFIPYAMTNRELTTLFKTTETSFTDIISGASAESNMNFINKFGNIVFFTLSLTGVTATAWSDTIAVVPSGYRPIHQLRIQLANDSKYAYIEKETGALKVNASLSNASLMVSGTYITS